MSSVSVTEGLQAANHPLIVPCCLRCQPANNLSLIKGASVSSGASPARHRVGFRAHDGSQMRIATRVCVCVCVPCKEYVFHHCVYSTVQCKSRMTAASPAAQPLPGLTCFIQPHPHIFSPALLPVWLPPEAAFMNQLASRHRAGKLR